MTLATLPRNVDELLSAMVRIPSVNSVVSGDPLAEQKMVEHNEAVARAMGFTTQRLAVPGRADNLLVTHRVDPRRPWVLLESHMDVVSVEGMTIDPFGGEVRDGRLWGRGSCDTKGTGAAMLWALHQYARAGGKACNVALLFVVDEEFGMTGIAQFARRQMAQLDWRPALAIIGEPTMLNPIVAHNGIVRWKMVARGVAAHSSNPSRGKSAITAILRAVDAVENRYTPSLTATDPMCGKAQCSVNIIRGGVQVNIIPEHCEAHADRRVVPGEDYRQVIPALQKLLDPVRASMPGVPIDIEVLFENPPLLAQSSRSVLPRLQQVLRGMGLSGEASGAQYGTDAAHLADAGVPTVVLGPGDIAKAHTKDEYLDLDQLHRGVEMYQAILNADWA
jgi:acetylornithine deacetylase